MREYRLQPTVFYRWQKRLFENEAAVFENRSDRPTPWEQKVTALEEKLARKNEVLAELLEAHVH